MQTHSIYAMHNFQTTDGWNSLFKPKEKKWILFLGWKNCISKAFILVDFFFFHNYFLGWRKLYFHIPVFGIFRISGHQISINVTNYSKTPQSQNSCKSIPQRTQEKYEPRKGKLHVVVFVSGTHEVFLLSHLSERSASVTSHSGIEKSTFSCFSFTNTGSSITFMGSWKCLRWSMKGHKLWLLTFKRFRLWLYLLYVTLADSVWLLACKDKLNTSGKVEDNQRSWGKICNSICKQKFLEKHKIKDNF